jgi:diguanylate cyclase (GGDEF)-like protein
MKRMAECGASFNGIAARGAKPRFETSEADFSAALLREQYRSLARLGPYVHGVVILAAVALLVESAPAGSLLDGVLLPAALIAVSVLRLVSWFQARAAVEVETLDAIRRKVRAASVLGPALAFAFALAAATSTWPDSVGEFAATLITVWVVAAVCAICLNIVAREASVIVVAATAPIMVALLARGAELTLGLAALIAVAAALVIRMLAENFRMFVEIVRSRFVIAEQQRLAEEARRAAITIALTDDLTGLPNRRCFQSMLADKIGTGRETGEPFALGLIDLDGFKPVNDVHGHPVGDEILKQVADRLAEAMDGRGSAVRMGGDEFAILCDRVGARGEALALGEEIQAILAAPFAVQSLHIRLSCACGFALFPSSAGGPSELVRLADAALYRAKATGCGAAVVDESAGVQGAGDAELAEALRGAGAEVETRIPFQPIADLTVSRIGGRKPFARLNSAPPERAAPPTFIPAPEPVGPVEPAPRDSLPRAAMIGAR